MSPVHTDRSEVYQQNEVAGKPISGSGLKYLGLVRTQFYYIVYRGKNSQRKAMKIDDLLNEIRNQDLVLPEFQREYVWSLEQAKQLMVSLSRSYPVGSLLLWKTNNPPELKNIDKLPDMFGTVKILLDGQQRLTTLYMLITGEVPRFYNDAEIENDPRKLFVNIYNLDFQYYQPSRMSGDSYWQRVVDCFDLNKEINVFQIAQDKSIVEGENSMKLAQQLMNNLNQIKTIKNFDIPEQIVPSKANLNQSIDIFDRVNSQGTKLTEAELALTHMVAKWPVARREIKNKIEDCASLGFEFSLTFMTRALTTTVTNRALFETIHARPREELGAWME